MALAIAKENVARWLEKLLQAGEVVAPVRSSCGDVLFSTITSAEQVVWDFPNSLHPPKELLLPQTDPIVRITRRGQHHEVEPIIDRTRRFLFNVRSCDAKGIAFLTRMQEMEPADASYLRRSNNLTVISLACTTPCQLGFCICTDSGPFLRDSYDAQLTDLGESYLVEVASPKGEAAVAEAQSLFRDATEGEVTQRQKLEDAARRHFGEETCHFASAMRRISTCRVPDALWEKMSDWCLECGGCSVVCPTCYCFSVEPLRKISVRQEEAAAAFGDERMGMLDLATQRFELGTSARGCQDQRDATPSKFGESLRGGSPGFGARVEEGPF